jgi:putative transposase
MSTKRKTYSAEFKAKVVLEVLEGNETFNQIASKYELLPANVKNWKKMFLENMSLAFDKSTVVKEYKDKIETLEKSNDNLAKKVGNLTIEKDFLEGKLVSLVSSKLRKTFVDTMQKTHQIGHPSRNHPATKNGEHPATNDGDDSATLYKVRDFILS